MYSKAQRWYINQQVAYALTCPMLVEDEKFVRRAQVATQRAESFFNFLNRLLKTIDNIVDLRSSFEYFKSKLKYLEVHKSQPYIYLKTKKNTRKPIQWIEFDLASNVTEISIEYVLPNPYLAYQNNNAFIEYFKDKVEEEGWLLVGDEYYKRAKYSDIYLLIDGFAGSSGFSCFFLLPFIKIRWDYEVSWDRP